MEADELRFEGGSFANAWNLSKDLPEALRRNWGREGAIIAEVNVGSCIARALLQARIS